MALLLVAASQSFDWIGLRACRASSVALLAGVLAAAVLLYFAPCGPLAEIAAAAPLIFRGLWRRSPAATLQPSYDLALQRPHGT